MLHPTPPLDLNAWTERIAKDLLGLDTLVTQGRDALDFHDVGVASLRHALEAALRLGYAAAQAGVPITPHSTGLDGSRLIPLFERLGLDPTGQVELEHSTTLTEHRARRLGHGRHR